MPSRATSMQARVVSGTAFAVCVAAIAIIALGALSGGTVHTLYAGFDNAIQMTPGQQVRVAGRPVGEISDIRLVDGQALVTLKITDDSVWPLPKGTYAIARWGSTTAYLGRYMELIPGPKTAGPLPNGGILEASQDSSAFELDQFYRLFRGRTKADTSRLLALLGQTLDGRAGEVSSGVAAAPGGLDQAAQLMEELSASDQELSTLVQSGDSTVNALAARSNDLSNLVSDAAGTFSEFAQHTLSEQQALDDAPGAFNTATSTFVRLDTSLNGLSRLVDALRPGAPALVRLAGSAQTALAALREVAPQATSTLEQGTAAAPEMRRLFTTGTSFMPTASKALGSFAPMLACVRPYAPEIAGFLSTWSGMTKNYDLTGHYARSFPLTVIQGLEAGTPLNSEQALSVAPGITYAMPRPPGLNAGHPWFLPQCGAGPNSLNAADDPEGAGK